VELGGKNPAIVFECDDLESCPRDRSSGLFMKWQRLPPEPVLVEESLSSDAKRRFASAFSAFRCNGLDECPTMGPLVARVQMETMARWRREGKEGPNSFRRTLTGKDAEQETSFTPHTL
jgi:acyl-CoA reductase-like NAD-dependent aldehyde dehydrogenase